MFKNFTVAEIIELSKIFGIKPVSRDKTTTANVRDGTICITDQVWWICVTGPEVVSAKEHWDNICEHPHCYSINKPKVKMTVYEDSPKQERKD